MWVVGVQFKRGITHLRLRYYNDFVGKICDHLYFGKTFNYYGGELTYKPSIEGFYFDCGKQSEYDKADDKERYCEEQGCCYDPNFRNICYHPEFDIC